MTTALEVFHNYSDLCVEIEVAKEQIKLTEYELEYWFGIRMNDRESNGIPLGARGVDRFGVNTALEQAEDKIRSLNKLRDRLDKLDNTRIKIETLLSNFRGLEYRIAYLRYVEGKSLREVADELGYSYDYIRELMSKMKKQPTENPQTY